MCVVYFLRSYFEAAITIGALRTSCFLLANLKQSFMPSAPLNLVCFYIFGQIIYSDLTRVLDPQKVANSKRKFRKIREIHVGEILFHLAR